MRLYRAPTLICTKCGGELRPSAFGGYVHRERVGIKDPRWHVAEVR